MVDLSSLCDDLQTEEEDLDAVLARLDAARWDLPTPAPGWSIRDQVSHLAFFEEQAELAASDGDAFATSLGRVTDAGAFMNEPLERGRELDPGQVRGWWNSARAGALSAFRRMDPARRIPWFGPPMSPASFVSARIMETWAHGQDVADALGIERAPTDRLRHIAHLGVRARRNSYAATGRELPADEVRVELTGPGGNSWTWNESATDRVAGEAVDFCLVVTQRRHPDDTDLVVEGELARDWMAIAQAFAGPPGAGRKPGQFAKKGAGR